MEKYDAIYARQSVDRVDSISIESQVEYCQQEVKGGKYKTYTDKGYSGKNTDRPQFQKMLEEIRRQLNFTTLRYNRLDDLIASTGLPREKLCTYCWDGRE